MGNSILDRTSLMTFQLLPEELFGILSPKKEAALASELGIKYLDTMNISTQRAEKLRKAMDTERIRSGCYTEFLPCFNGGEGFKDKLKGIIDKASILGTEKIMIVAVKDNEKGELGTMDREDAYSRLKDYFSETVSIAGESGIIVTFENSPNPLSCLQTAEECIRILNDVDGLGLAFDTALPLSYGGDPLKFYNIVKDKVRHVHIRDGVSVGDGNARQVKTVVYGNGTVPVAAIRDALLSDGYDGLFAIEYSRPGGLLHGLKGYKKHLESFISLFV